MATKVTVNLPDDTLESLRQIAKDRGITVTEAMRQVIESQRFLHDETSTGSKVLLEKPDQPLRQVIFNTPKPSKA